MIETIISNFHLEKIWYIIRKHLAICIIVGALGGIAGGAYAYMTSSTTYSTMLSFYVYTDPDYVNDNSVNITSNEIKNATYLAQSYILILKSNTVMEKVAESAGVDYSPEALAARVSTKIIDGTSVFYVYVIDYDPGVTYAIANAIGEIAPSEVSRIVKAGGIEVVDFATMPTSPYSSTNIYKFVLIGFVGGFAFVLVIFLLLGLLDTTVRRKYELRLSFTIPILGDIPFITSKNKKIKVEKILQQDSPFAIKESYGAIRNNMLFTGKGEKCPVYAITSAEQNEGKTLTSVNIAISYSQLGKRVLLIDADMRNISVSKRLGIDFKTGLSDYLAGLVKVVEKKNYSDNLDVISGGSIPPNPAELLASNRMDELIETSKEIYDCIIIDLPPVGIISDALLLAKKVTSYILVVRAFQSKMAKERATVAMLERVDADICGFIFNGVDQKSQDYSYKKYGYDYKYVSESESKKKEK